MQTSVTAMWNGPAGLLIMLALLTLAEAGEHPQREGKSLPVDGVRTQAVFSFVPAWTNVTGVKGLDDSGSGWRVQRSAASAGDVNRDGFDDVLIGSPKFTPPGLTEAGRVWLFLGSRRGLGQVAAWQADGELARANFGFAVSGAGDVNGDGFDDVIIGSYNHSSLDQNLNQYSSGKIYVYYGSRTGLGSNPDWTYEQFEAGAHSFGISVASAGDVNHDGFDDIVAGDFGYSTEVGGTYSGFLGMARVFYGSASGLVKGNPFFTATGERLSYFGCSVCGAGDINGDGYDDLAVAGIYAGDDGLHQRGSGMFRVYPGGPAGLSGDGYQQFWPVPAPSYMFAFLGSGISRSGDVNGDGYDDLLVGASGFNVQSQSQGGSGAAFLYFGSALGLTTNRVMLADPAFGASKYGTSVAGVGDVNGDDVPDIVVGLPALDQGPVDRGAAYLYYGPVTSDRLATAAADGILLGNTQYAWLGAWIAPAGDINGDLGDDFLVQAPMIYSGDLSQAGATYLFLGASKAKPPRGAALLIR